MAAARAVEGDRADPWSGVLALARGGLIDAARASAARRRRRSPRFAGPCCRSGPSGSRRAAPSDEIPLGRALAEAVRAAAAEQPVVLAVDDAQWLDHDSALALGAMLRDLQRRPADAGARDGALPAAARARRAPEPDRAATSRAARCGSGGWTARRSGSLAERMLPGYDPISLDRVVRRVATDSAGLPLFAVELLRAVALGLDLGTIAGTWPEPLRTLDQSLPGDLPDAVVAAIRVAFRRLSPAAQRVLVSAAVLGDLAAPPCSSARSRWPRTSWAARSTSWSGTAGWWPSRGAIRSPRGSCARWCSATCSRPGQRRRVLEAARGRVGLTRVAAGTFRRRPASIEHERR